LFNWIKEEEIGTKKNIFNDNFKKKYFLVSQQSFSLLIRDDFHFQTFSTQEG